MHVLILHQVVGSTRFGTSRNLNVPNDNNNNNNNRVVVFTDRIFFYLS